MEDRESRFRRLQEARPSYAPPAEVVYSRCGERVGDYQLLYPIGQGGMGTVYVARCGPDADINRLYAVKMPHPELLDDEPVVDMLMDEARIAAQLRHPNVAGVLAVPRDAHGNPALAMEYVEGAPLSQLMNATVQAGVRLPAPVLLRFVCDGLMGLEAAHDLRSWRGDPLRIVHRDVSPGNLMVGIEGVTRLLDFGIASAEDRLSRTRNGMIKGKVSYMAPERILHGHADARSDVFSMGVVLWEILAGQRLFRAAGDWATAQRVLSAVVPAISAIRPELRPLDHVIARALHRDPELRFRSAADFLDCIEDVASQVGGTASPRRVAQHTQPFLLPRVTREREAVREALEELERGTRRGSAFYARPHCEPASEEITTIEDVPTSVLIELRQPRRAFRQALLDERTTGSGSSH